MRLDPLFCTRLGNPVTGMPIVITKRTIHVTWLELGPSVPYSTWLGPMTYAPQLEVTRVDNHDPCLNTAPEIVHAPDNHPPVPQHELRGLLRAPGCATPRGRGAQKL